MKKSIIAFCFIFVLLFNFSIVSTAQNTIDTEKNCSFSLDFSYENKNEKFGDLEVKLYKVATFIKSGEMELTGVFKNYPINIKNVKEQSEWEDICTTLVSYISADKISPDYTAKTNKSGITTFKNIKPAIYLMLPATVITSNKKTVFKQSLISAPQYMLQNDEYIYNFTIYPKSESFDLNNKKIEYRVIKEWQDSGFKSYRPKNIQIDIYKDNKLAFSETLKSSNNWTYSWKTVDDGSNWYVVERNVSENYNVKISEKSNTFIVTNTHVLVKDDSPVTGDTTVIWPIILLMCISGIFIIILSIWRKRIAQ